MLRRDTDGTRSASSAPNGCMRRVHHDSFRKVLIQHMNEITVYAIRTDTVRRLDSEEVEKVLPGRAARARRFRFEKDRLLCLGAGFLLIRALGIRSEAEIHYGAMEKPFAPGYPAFNLSHSGEWCILATGDTRTVGADIEEIDERHIDVAPNVYTEAELRWMAEDPVNRFFRLWTWKEGVMKATGLGMSLEPLTFEALPFAEGKGIRILDRMRYNSEGKRDHCMFSVCTEEPADRIRWEEIT